MVSDLSSHDKYDDDDDIDYDNDCDVDDDSDDDDDEDDDVDDEILLLHCYVQTSKTRIPYHGNNLDYCSLRFHLIGRTMYEMNLFIDQKLELDTRYNITSSSTGKYF